MLPSLRTAVDELRGNGAGWTLLAVAASWLFLSAFRVVLPALLPQVKSGFGVGNASAGFALTVLWVLYATFQFPGGIAADRVGERRLLLLGLAFANVSLLVFYVAPVFALFLVACGVFGVGAGLFGTPRDMLLSRMFPERVNTAYSVTFAAGSLGGAVLPLLATEIATRTDWRTAIISLLPLLLVATVGLWWFAPRARSEADRESRLSALATARRTATAVTDRSVVLAGGAFMFFLFTYQALVAFLPTYLVEIKGMEQSFAAALFGLLFVVGAVVQPFVGHVADRYGGRVTMLGLVAFSTGTLLALPFVAGRVALVVLVPLLGVRIAMGPVTSAYIVGALPEPIEGTGWGMLRTAFFALGATGSTVTGVFADAGLFDEAFLVLAGLTAVIGACWLFVRPDGETAGG